MLIILLGPHVKVQSASTSTAYGADEVVIALHAYVL
jgi:hypothetical protein